MHCTSFSELNGFVFIRQTVSFSSQFTNGTSAIFSNRDFSKFDIEPRLINGGSLYAMMMTEKGRVG